MSNENEEFKIKLIPKPNKIRALEEDLVETNLSKAERVKRMKRRLRTSDKPTYFPLPDKLVKQLEKSTIKKCIYCGSNRITIKEGFYKCMDCKGALGEVSYEKY